MTDQPGQYWEPNPDAPSHGQLPEPSPAPTPGPGPSYGYPPPPPQQPYGYPPAGYQPYPPPPYAQPYLQQQGTNGFAIASMVLGIVWIYWIGSVLAIVFGFIARSQIRQRNQGGDGMAIAGIVLGIVGVVIAIIVIIVAIAATNEVNHHFQVN